MRVGIDSYSYHRLLGEIRPGEEDPGFRFPNGSIDAIAQGRALGVDAVALQTCYLGPPSQLDVEALRRAAGPLELALSWGAPNGLEFGANDAALRDLLDWLELAPALGCRLTRIVAAGPSLRGAEPVEAQLERAVKPLGRASALARERGIELALENHGDLTIRELADLISRVGDPALGVCFDTGNALRVGDDPVEAAAIIAPLVRMVHVRDIEPVEAADDPIAGPRSVAYGTGVVPVARALAKLGEAGFDGLACVEIGQLAPAADEQALVSRSVSWLRAYGRARPAA